MITNGAQEKLVAQFNKANATGKKAMLGSLPSAMLHQDGPILPFLGSEPEVWIAYVINAGSEVLANLPTDFQNRLEPLFAVSPELAQVALEASLHTETAVARIWERWQAQPSEYQFAALAMQHAGDVAAPAILWALRSADPLWNLVGMNAYFTRWIVTTNRQQAMDAVFALVFSPNNEVASRAVEVLVSQAPERLVEAANQFMEALPAEPTPKQLAHPLVNYREVAANFELEVTDNTRKFVRLTLRKEVPWANLQYWLLLVMLKESNTVEAAKLLAGAETMAIQLGRALHRQANDVGKEAVVNAWAMIVRKAFEKDLYGPAIRNFLANTINDFTVNDAIYFLKKIAEIAPDDLEALASKFTYSDWAIDGVYATAFKLEGVLRAYGMLRVIKLCTEQEKLGSVWLHKAISNLITNISALTPSVVTISPLLAVPIMYWRELLDVALEAAPSAWKVILAFHALQHVNAEYELAVDALGQLMLIPDAGLQLSVVKGFEALADKE